nr:hypothetical protein [Tanacetum cinerariifolium]
MSNVDCLPTTVDRWSGGGQLWSSGSQRWSATDADVGGSWTNGRMTHHRSIRKGLFVPNGGRGEKVEVSFDNFGGGGEEIKILVAMVEEEVLYLEEVGGVENKSLMISMLIAKYKECLDDWVRAGGGEVKGGGVDLGVTKSFLGETPRETGGEEVGVDRGDV